MSVDIRDLLPLYALGILEDDEARTVERAVARDPVLARELAALQSAAHTLVAPVAPSRSVFARLMASAGKGRFEQFTDKIAALYELSADRVRELFGLTERTASWSPQLPGVELLWFPGGLRFADADCGFIRLAAGTVFPPHTHLGEEVSVILAGQLKDLATGVVYKPGDEITRPQDAEEHLLQAIGDEDCIYAARAMNGIAVMGVPQRPNR